MSGLSSIPESGDPPDASANRESLELRVEALQFDLELARRVHARLEAETLRLHQHIAAIDADRASLRNRLDERERYLGAILSSVGWKVIQAVRGLFGRRW